MRIFFEQIMLTKQSRLLAYCCAALSIFMVWQNETRASTAPSPVAGGGSSPTAEWTIMIYMNANNNLESAAFKNFAQLAQIPSSDNVNFIVLFARQAQYVAYPEWKGALTFQLKPGLEPTFDDSLEKRNDAGLDESHIPNPDMGKPETLGDFVSRTRDQFPAKHYVLVIWDHGQGWRIFDTIRISSPASLTAISRDRKFNIAKALDLRKQFSTLVTLPASQTIKQDPGLPNNLSLKTATFRSISVDEAHGGTQLYNRDIQDTLTRVLKGDKLDILGFDACLMAMVETAYAMRGVADYMVGSEELEPGPGWDYQKCFSPLVANPSLGSQDLAKIIVQAYRDTYQGSEPSTAMSAVNLSSISSFANSIDAFSSALIAGLKNGNDFQLIKQMRSLCVVFAPGYGAQGIDFGQFSELIASTSQNRKLQEPARQARLALDSAVLKPQYMGAERPCAYGLAIYFPANKALFSADAQGRGYDRANNSHPVEFVHDHKWVDFINAYCSKVPH